MLLYRKYYLTLWLVIACVGILFAYTDSYAQGQPGPCAGEIAKFCKDVKPGGGRLVKCIKEHEKELSPACLASLGNVEKKLEDVQPAPKTGQNVPGAFKRDAQAAPKAGLNFPDTFKKDIGAELQICGIGQSCSGDMGSLQWRKEATINSDDELKALTWRTNSKEVTHGLLQISLMPFNDSWPADTIHSQNVSLGNFVFNFKILFASQKAVKPAIKPMAMKSAQSTPGPAMPNIKKAGVNTAYLLSNLVYHIRVVPMNGINIAGRPTNEVTVKIVPPAKGFQLFTPPKIYTIKIKEFKPLLAPDKGVCSQAMILDTDGLVPKRNGMGFEYKKAGDRICPKPFMGLGERSWYEQLWNAMTSGLSWVSEAYKSLKSSIVNAVGSVACGGNDTCVKGLSAGLDIGLTALGLPPTIPNFDQLMDGGFDYLAGELSAQAGCPDAACKDLIKNGLKTALDQNKNTNPGCVDAAAAHAMGMEPLCLPAGVKAHWDQAATYRSAKVVLEVSRNSVTLPNESKAAGVYRVFLSLWATNAVPVGYTITNIDPYNKSLKITKPLDAELFTGGIIPIPYLEKGQKMDIPVNLVATKYWVPGHKELMGGWSTVTFKDGWPQYQYDDWWMLYYGAQLTISADIDGCPYGGVDCLISSDTKSLTLPMTLYP